MVQVQTKTKNTQLKFDYLETRAVYELTPFLRCTVVTIVLYPIFVLKKRKHKNSKHIRKFVSFTRNKLLKIESKAL